LLHLSEVSHSDIDITIIGSKFPLDWALGNIAKKNPKLVLSNNSIISLPIKSTLGEFQQMFAITCESSSSNSDFFLLDLGELQHSSLVLGNSEERKVKKRPKLENIALEDVGGLELVKAAAKKHFDQAFKQQNRYLRQEITQIG
jgi:hypothetical protein